MKMKGKPMNLLLIDDDVGCLDSLQTALTPAGYECETITDPRMAIGAYKDKRHNAVITDIKMPGLSGIEILKEIRSFDPKACIIIITGFGDLNTAIQAVNNGAYAFFTKPLNIPDIMNTLGKIETEAAEGARLEQDYAKLAVEYSKLKQAYVDLLDVFKRSDRG